MFIGTLKFKVVSGRDRYCTLTDLLDGTRSEAYHQSSAFPSDTLQRVCRKLSRLPLLLTVPLTFYQTNRIINNVYTLSTSNLENFLRPCRARIIDCIIGAAILLRDLELLFRPGCGNDFGTENYEL